MSSRKRTMIITLATVLVLFAIAIGAWWYLFFGKPNSPLKRADVSIASSSPSGTSADVISVPIVNGENPPLASELLSINSATFNVEVASTTLEKTRGLSFRPSLGENDGMLFIFGSGTVQTFWMKDMHFPLDMIWISGNTVVGFAQNVPAPAAGTQLWQLPLYSSPNNTDKVLEVNAGIVAKFNIKVGNIVTIGPIK